jgi:hypothetical protein
MQYKSLGILIAVFMPCFLSWSLLFRSDATEPIAIVDAQPKPIDVNMHDFMEGVFQSPYLRLKKSMSAEPKDNASWKLLRSDALILAEGGNLVMMRKPEKDIQAWEQFSVASRNAGEELVKAAKLRDFKGASTAYQSMLKHCNACHQQFAEGKHQLAP